MYKKYQTMLETLAAENPRKIEKVVLKEVLEDYRFEEFVWTKKEIDEEYDRLVVLAKERQRKEQREYSARYGEIWRNFKQDLFIAEGLDNVAANEVIWGEAVEVSDTTYDVYHDFVELVGLVDDVLKAIG